MKKEKERKKKIVDKRWRYLYTFRAPPKEPNLQKAQLGPCDELVTHPGV